MKIGTILFTYHRSKHTKKVLDALAENSILPEKLYIFQDGIKESTNIVEWNKVGQIIHDVDWCETEIHISDENKGLAKSITSGLDYVLSECEAVIVLEDDCVPGKHFMKFMKTALEKYHNEEKVYSVSGYAWDIRLPEDEYDAYFNGRACSFGWGTWKNRWNQYEENYDILKKIKNNQDMSHRLAIWGYDLEEMLEARVAGRNNSWAVFWALKTIEKGGYCLSPYRQLIHNIGFDGSGENCGIVRERYEKTEGVIKENFRFPCIVQSTQECEEEFQFLYARKCRAEKLKSYYQLLIQWLQMKQKGHDFHITEDRKKNLAVWGKGALFDCLIRETHLSVQCIIESRPCTEMYQNIPIVSVDEIPLNIQNIIVIPYFDILIIEQKIKKLRPDIQVLGLNELIPDI